MSLEVNSRWERRTWVELRRLAQEVPEAGIHFQGQSFSLGPHTNQPHTSGKGDT